MSYIWGGNSPTSGNVGDLPSDLRRSADRPHAAAHGGTARVVPDLYRRAVDHTATYALAALLYPAIVWAYRDERKAGQR